MRQICWFLTACHRFSCRFTRPGARQIDRPSAPPLENLLALVPDDELLAVHEALDRLAGHDAQKAELVKLRYFASLSIEETATALRKLLFAPALKNSVAMQATDCFLPFCKTHP